MMCNQRETSIKYYGRWLVSGATSLLALVSAGIYAEDSANRDIQLWLQQSPPQTPIDAEQSYYMAAEDGGYLNANADSDKPDINIPLPRIAKGSFKSISKTIHKVNEKKLLRKLSDSFKLSLFKHRDRRQQHRLYVNLVKQELVGKHHYRGVKYDIRLSEKAARLRLRYSL